jgi:hypothetical protein
MNLKYKIRVKFNFTADLKKNYIFQFFPRSALKKFSALFIYFKKISPAPLRRGATEHTDPAVLRFSGFNYLPDYLFLINLLIISGHLL